MGNICFNGEGATIKVIEWSKVGTPPHHPLPMPPTSGNPERYYCTTLEKDLTYRKQPLEEIPS